MAIRYLYHFCILMILVLYQVTAQYSLSTNAPFATRDQEFMLTCSLSNAEAAMTWSRNRVSVVNIRISDCVEGYTNQELYNQYKYNCTTSSRRYNLIIPTPRIYSEADSKWYCGSSGGGNNSRTYTIQFYTPPTEDPALTGYDGSPRFLGNRVVLNCSVNGGIPLATLSWTCNGTPVPGMALGTSAHTVTIDTSYNGQRCSCTASHPTWTVDKEIQSQTFVVHYSPTRDPVVSGYDGSVRYKGDTVTITCQVSGGSPLATLSWTCDGQPQNVNLSVLGTTVTSVLTITLQKGHNGKMCICHGRHSDTRYTPNISSRTFLVYYPPRIQAILSPSSIKEGQDVMMTCLAEGVPDRYIYNGWTQIYRNQIIRSSNDFSTLSQNKRNLTLSGVSYQDIGTYRCSANNDIPDKYGNLIQTGEKDLDIKFSAVFNSSRTFYSELNRTIEIKIPFLSNPPVVAANISLTKDNIDQISSGISVAVRNRNLDINFYGKVINVNGQEVVVTLHSFNSKLQGNYTIGVKNLQGGSLSTLVFEVIPSGPPESPMKFGVLSVTSNSITVTWLRGFNGGHKQTFVVLYQQKDSKEKLFSEIIMEEDNKENYTLAIRNLMSQTEYDFWIYSYNIKGNDSTEFTNVSPVAVKTEEVDDGINMGVIIGVVVAILCVIIVLAIIGGIFFNRLGSRGAKRKSGVLENENFNLNEDKQRNTDKQKDGMRINILYNSNGANFKKPDTAVVTAYSDETRGNKSGVDNPAALYAEVQKKKPPIDPSAVYAEVQKPNQKQKDGTKPKKGEEKKGNKKDKTTKIPNENGEMGMLYENVEPVEKDKSDDASGGKVPSLSTGAIPNTKNKPTKSGKRNEDGLIYVGLELQLPSQTRDKKTVIHGSKNRTDYAEIDFSRRVASLPPETDDVQNGGKQHINLKHMK